jgi:hypothetical protein
MADNTTHPHPKEGAIIFLLPDLREGKRNNINRILPKRKHINLDTLFGSKFDYIASTEVDLEGVRYRRDSDTTTSFLVLKKKKYGPYKGNLKNVYAYKCIHPEFGIQYLLIHEGWLEYNKEKHFYYFTGSGW